jgi:FtsP/CotA-like multicopper oxidase with cupredoxin domain
MTPQRLRRNTRTVVGVVATAALVVPLALMWSSSLLPSSYSVMGMGYAEFGGGPADPVHADHAAFGWDGPPPQLGDVSVAELTGPASREPDVVVDLTARAGTVELGGGVSLDGYTVNGQSPGPEVRVRQGDLVEVRLVNENVPDGTTLHWHGVDLPNAEDGVAGVTQDAVPAGETHTYRFIADDPGTYWYHSHKVSHAQVRGGLFGTLVVDPAEDIDVDHDVVAAVHTYGQMPTVNGTPGELRHSAEPGESIRVRVVNTDNSVRRVWVAGAAYRVVAMDARDLHQPTDLSDTAMLLAAGGRADLEFTTPADGSAVGVELGGASLVVGPDGAPPPAVTPPADLLDLLDYGSPTALPFDPSAADRVFDYRIGRRPGFLDGKPGMLWTINGRTYPDVPMFVVAESDVVRMTISNSKADNHPMHLHGHHAIVLSRNGVAATGSPWWVDSLEVGRGETYEIAFVADNPGIWMDHCHDLVHASDGLVAHLAYTGVYTPYRIGDDPGNQPE